MQLVSDDIVMIDTMKDKTYDIAAVKERFGVGPEKVVEILGLMGDTSDNIPGVPGIGPKGAQRLIEQFGSIEEILAHPEKIHNAKTREAILQNADQARLSRELAQIRTDAEFDVRSGGLPPAGAGPGAPHGALQGVRILVAPPGAEDPGGGDGRRLPDRPDAGGAGGARRQGCGEVREFSLDPLLSSPEAMRASLVGPGPLARAGRRRSTSPSPMKTARRSFPPARSSKPWRPSSPIRRFQSTATTSRPP